MAHLKPVEAPVSLTIPNNMNARRSSSVQMTAKLAALRGENFGNETCSKPKDADEEKKKNKPTVRFMKKSGKCNIRQVRQTNKLAPFRNIGPCCVHKEDKKSR